MGEASTTLLLAVGIAAAAAGAYMLLSRRDEGATGRPGGNGNGGTPRGRIVPLRRPVLDISTA